MNVFKKFALIPYPTFVRDYQGNKQLGGGDSLSRGGAGVASVSSRESTSDPQNCAGEVYTQAVEAMSTTPPHT